MTWAGFSVDGVGHTDGTAVTQAPDVPDRRFAVWASRNSYV